MTEKERRNPLDDALQMLQTAPGRGSRAHTEALTAAAEQIGFGAAAADKPTAPAGGAPRPYRPAEPPLEPTTANVSWRAAGRSTAISLRVRPEAYEKFRHAAAVLRLPLGGMFEEMVEFYVAARGLGGRRE